MRSKTEGKLTVVSLLAALLVASAVAAQAPVKSAAAPERLLSDLKSKDASVRRAAANQLGAIRARDATRLLIAALSDKDATAREAAAFALGQIADAAATDPLITALSDSASDVRASAAFALGVIGNRKAIAALSNALDDTDQSVRSSAIVALGLMQDEEAVDEVIDMLNDSAFDVRYDAVWALGQIGEPDAGDHIRAALVGLDVLRIDESSREAFRQAVQNSLEILASRDSGIPEPEQSSRPRRVGRASGLPGVVPKSKGYSNAFMPATVRQTVRPAMTARATQARVSGAVGLRAFVGVNGRAVRAYVTRRLGYGLDQRAVEAALQYRFDPAMQKGLPQVDWINLEVKF